jgi:hypothetical protein
MLHAWRGWMNWAALHPAKRRPLAQLSVSNEIIEKTNIAAHNVSSGLTILIDRCWKSGSMRDQPFSFVAAIVESIAAATMDSMIDDPARAESYCLGGFEALWRAIS